MSITARIIERDNGLPVVGDQVYDIDTDTIYEVLSLDGPVHCGQPGAGNYIWANVQDTGRAAGDLDEEEWEAIGEYGIELADDEEVQS